MKKVVDLTRKLDCWKSSLMLFTYIEAAIHLMIILAVWVMIMAIHGFGDYNPFTDLGILVIFICFVLPFIYVVTGGISAIMLPRISDALRGIGAALLFCLGVLWICFQAYGLNSDAAPVEYVVFVCIYAAIILGARMIALLIKILLRKKRGN